jgi:hypothetical protein
MLGGIFTSGEYKRAPLGAFVIALQSSKMLFT